MKEEEIGVSYAVCPVLVVMIKLQLIVDFFEKDIRIIIRHAKGSNIHHHHRHKCCLWLTFQPKLLEIKVIDLTSIKLNQNGHT